MKSIYLKFIFLILILFSLQCQNNKNSGVNDIYSQQSPEEIIAGFEKRVNALFQDESGLPLVRLEIGKPIQPGRGNFSRHYSWSLLAFASRCLFLNEMVDEANAAICENARHYLNNPRDIYDRDSFHWHADMVMRLIEMYGSKGSKYAGLITPETEALALQPIWLYVKQSSSLKKAEHEQSKTWSIYSSENHHFMDLTVCWHFSKIARDLFEYKNLKYDDGYLAEEHYDAWNEYFRVYCLERAKKGVCIEMMSDHYNSVFIKGFYNFYDFGDADTKKVAGMFLDLFWAYWAQEQIKGVTGGGKSRISFHEALQPHVEYGTESLAWLYFGIGEQPAIHGQDINAVLSDYRPPAVVVDIARDIDERGSYTVLQRAQGLGKQGKTHANTTEIQSPSKARTDGGGIIRYSYCDPAFIIGSPLNTARPLSDWMAISSQGRWQGVIFAGNTNSRIVPIVKPKNNLRALNTQWSVQSKGTLITQKLIDNRGGDKMIVWISKEGLSVPEEAEGVIFIEANDAYAAIRICNGNYIWNENIYTINKPEGIVYKTPPGWTLIPNKKYSPVILEVMAKRKINSFSEFKNKVMSLPVKMDGPILKYTSIYGDKITFDTSYKEIPKINKNPVDFAPEKVFESPYLTADYNSGIVTISKGTRKKVLDFKDIGPKE
jgi:hypothetical protein